MSTKLELETLAGKVFKPGKIKQQKQG